MKDDIIAGGGWNKEPKTVFRLKLFSSLFALLGIGSIIVVKMYEFDSGINITLWIAGAVFLLLSLILLIKEKGTEILYPGSNNDDIKKLHIK